MGALLTIDLGPTSHFVMVDVSREDNGKIGRKGRQPEARNWGKCLEHRPASIVEPRPGKVENEKEGATQGAGI